MINGMDSRNTTPPHHAAHSDGTISVCIVILTAVALTVALIYTRPILVPLTIAIFLSSIFSALSRWVVEKTKAPQSLSLFIDVTVASLLFAVLVYVSYYCFVQVSSHLDSYKEKFMEIINHLLLWGKSHGVDINKDVILWELENLPFANYARSFTENIFNLVGNIVLTFVFVFFLTAGAQARKNKLPKMFSEIHTKVSHYASAKFMMSVFTGALVALILFLFDLELALMFGVITCVLNFIPTLGAVVATVLPIPFLFLQFEAPKVILVTTLIGIVQLAIGSFLEPKIYGGSLDLHPITILVFLIFWGLVWGLAGMFLAVPITCALKIVLSRIEVTRSISEMLSGRFL